MSKTIWETLNELDIKKYIKKKGQLDYLPWSAAVGLVKPYFPDMRVKVYETENGINYFTDGRTCWVKVGVTIQDREEIEYLPIMDFKNKSIPLNAVTSVDINKAIKRATVKALSLHGLGIFLYVGEELPSKPDNVDELRDELAGLIEKSKDKEKTTQWIFKTYKVESLEELSNEDLKSIIKLIKQKASK